MGSTTFSFWSDMTASPLRITTIAKSALLIALVAACSENSTAPAEMAAVKVGGYNRAAISLQPIESSNEGFEKAQNATLAAVFGSDLITGGSFEAATGTTFPGWFTYNSGSGFWYSQSGTGSPQNGFGVSAPSHLLKAAMTDQSGPGTHMLMQKIVIPAGGAEISFDLMLNNTSGSFTAAGNIIDHGPVAQFARVDLIDPAFPVATAAPSVNVLQNLYTTRPGDPAVTPYRRITVTTSPSLNGRVVYLRFMEIDNRGFFNTGVDNVTMFALQPADVTPPVVTPNVTGTLGNNGWYTSDVSVTWTTSDPESPITSAPCGAVTVTSDTGSSTFTCSATSLGGTSSGSVTISKDATGPEVAYSGNAGTYTLDQNVSISCSATDALSGIDSNGCASINGAGYTFGLGVHNYSATATDKAGNPNTAATSFTVTATSASLCTMTKAFVSGPGEKGIENSLCTKLEKGNYAPYINEVQAQSGKSITAANAQLLILWAQSL
jgi:hypothetical protein